MPAPKVDKYVLQARKLKSAGLIDKVPRAKDLTPQIKAQITRKYNQATAPGSFYKSVMARPKDYKIREVDAKTNAVLKKSGYLTPTKNKVIIPLRDGDEKFKTVRIYKDHITFSREGKKEKVFLVGDPEAMLRKAAELAEGKKRNQLVSFKIGGAGVSNFVHESIESAREYLENVVLPRFYASAIVKNKGKPLSKKQKAAIDAQFWTSVSIVTIEGQKFTHRG